MAHAQLLELEFESNLCSELAEHGWLYEADGSTAVADWNVGLALVPQDVLYWLSTQYPNEYEKAVPADLTGAPRATAETKLLTHLTKELAKHTRMDPTTGQPTGGLLGVLRRGFSYAQVGRAAAKFGPMMEFPPANPDLTGVAEASDAVRLRILRQVRFDATSTETLDVVLTANGIPVVTMELKTDNTQTVNHAIHQYKEDRRPGRNRPLLAPGRALVHFAVSNDLVFMTTKLEGEDTVFLPFNQGDNGHAGNPASATGSATDYLWRDILARPTFMRIIKNYAMYEPSRQGGRHAGRLVVPRFHQLRAVERVVADIEQRGPGGRYLIWHSAGSGKTKTIAWLSHRLIRHMDAGSRSTFDSVIVVTDRIALDENIRDDMNLVQASRGLVVSVGEGPGAKSPQLKQALIEGDHIITCTLQTFPVVMELIEDTGELRGRRWAVVADEAHSSQSGSAARDLKALLADVEVEDPDDISADELLAATGLGHRGLQQHHVHRSHRDTEGQDPAPVRHPGRRRLLAGLRHLHHGPGHRGGLHPRRADQLLDLRHVPAGEEHDREHRRRDARRDRRCGDRHRAIRPPASDLDRPEGPRGRRALPAQRDAGTGRGRQGHGRHQLADGGLSVVAADERLHRREELHRHAHPRGVLRLPARR
jgi:type I restriction enzyme R subunit